MKITGLTLIVLLFQVLSARSAQTDDTERVARSLLFFDEVDRYNGRFYGQKTNSLWSLGDFVMNRDMQVTNITVDNEIVPIPVGWSLTGLPFPEGTTMYHYDLWMSARDTRGEEKARGTYHTDLLNDASVIKVVLRPGLIQKFIAYIPPAYLSNDLVRLTLSNGSSFGYDATRRGFVIRLDPLADDQSYTIVDGRTGAVLSTGIVGPFRSADTLPQKVITVSYAGNVTEAYFPRSLSGDPADDSLWLHNQIYNSTILSSNSYISGKVYITDLKFIGGLIIWISDPDATITVKQWQENGELPKLDIRPIAVDDPTTSKSVYTDTATADQLGKLIVTVTSPHTNKFFTVGFVRYTDDPTLLRSSVVRKLQ